MIFNSLINDIKQAFLQFQWSDAIDIVILAAIIYQLIKITKETRASQVLKGFGIIIIAAWVTQQLSLSGTAWVLSAIVNAGVIALVILFQPELRRALERLGSGRLPDNTSISGSGDASADSADEIVRAVQNLAKKRIGALIALQQANTLNHIVESGVTLDAKLNASLIENIFFPNSPLHDGAMIVSGSRIIAAGCFLPLAANAKVPPEVGTRHRAAIGMTEATDAVVIIVSEETGIISIAEGGRLTRYLDAAGLRLELSKIYGRKPGAGGRLNHLIKRRKDGVDKRD